MAMSVSVSTRANAQSFSDLAAFGGLIVSPSGAFTPIGSENGQTVAEHTALSFRYTGWRYDIDDAVHNNMAVTYAHRIGGSRFSLSLTGAYLQLACSCAVWASGGVGLKTMLWSSNSTRTTASRAAHVALDLTTGGARYSGPGHAIAKASSGVLDIGIGVATFKHTRLSIALHPGIGYGQLESVDATGHGTRALLGASMSWRMPMGLSLDVGVQRIVLAGGPTQFGGGLSWRGK